MRTAKIATSSETMLDLGRYHLAALAQSEGTRPLASAFQTVQDALESAAAARVAAEKAMTGPRVVVRFAETALERVIRRAALLCHGADNNTTSGPAFKALFPNGLDAELRPVGTSQLAAAVSMRERLDTQPAAVPVKEQILDEFDGVFGAFKSAVEARQEAETKVSQARAVEFGARQRFVSAYDSNAGAIRQMFPRDRTHQDLHFEEIPVARSSAEDKPPATPEPGAASP